MERLQLIQDNIYYPILITILLLAINIYKQNPHVIQITLGLTGLYITSKVYNKWKYSQTLFTEPTDIGQKVILITGCDTGFGHATALKLSIELEYRVIATCLKQESVDQMQSNKQYTKNGSTAVLMDVTKKEDIERVKQFAIQYLEQTDGLEFWGFVNNAGIGIQGSFEVVPKELSEYETNVLYKGPVDICRAFLPLLPGRKNWKQLQSGTSSIVKTSNNGGRIVNIASVGARCIVPVLPRYCAMKAALASFSHAMRMDISPRFGIWVSSVEPGGYMTPIVQKSMFWFKQVEKKVKENNEAELLDIYEFPDLNKMQKVYDKAAKTRGKSIMFNDNINEVVDCIIHGLTAKYPRRSYEVGWAFLIQCFVYLPLWMTEPIRIKVQRRMDEELKRN
eukprot:215828_1